MSTYLHYLFYYIFRHISLYVVAFIYFFILVVFLCIVPCVANVNFITQNVTWFTALFMSAILSSLIIVYLFKKPQDDGSELIISSKPLVRHKMVAAKYIVCLVSFLVFSFSIATGALFAFLSPGASVKGVWLLFVCFFVGNFVIFIFFGGLALLFGVYWSKTVVILVNVVLLLLMSFYSIIVDKMPESWYSKMTENSVNYIDTQEYVDKNEKVYHAAYIVPTSLLLNFEISDLSKIYLEGEKQTLKEAQASSSIVPLTTLDLFQQLNNQFCFGPIRDATLWNQGTNFGNIGHTNYTIDHLVHQNIQQTNEYTDDDAEQWMSSYNDDEPLFSLDVDKLSIADTQRFMQINTGTSGFLNNIYEAMTLLMNFWNNIEVDYWGRSEILGNIEYVHHDVNNSHVKRTYNTMCSYEGNPGHSNRTEFSNAWAYPTDNEREVFNYLLYEILFDVNSNLAQNTFEEWGRSDQLYWKYDLKVDSTDSYFMLYKLLYNEIANGRNKELIYQLVPLNSVKDWGHFYTKFRYYLQEQLKGGFGFLDFKFNHDFKDTSNNVIDHVPWAEYFKYVFLPINNSLNTRIYENLTKSWKPFPKLSLNFQELFGNGFIPLPDYSNGTNGLSLFATTNNSLDKFLPQYDGSGYPSDCGNIDYNTYIQQFQIWDPTDITQTKDGVYGYYSPLGLKASALMNHFASGKEDCITYYNDIASDDYQARLYRDRCPLVFYELSLFKFSQTDFVPQWASCIFFLSISAILYIFTFKKFNNYDIQ